MRVRSRSATARSISVRTPPSALSAREREQDKIAALDVGADDYVEKPFSVGELLARIRTALRHRLAQQGLGQVYRAGPVEIDLERRQVSLDGGRLELTPREYALLELLVRSVGKVVTHRQLLTGVWGPAHAEDVQYLRVYVRQLRQKLGRAGALVETEPGVGYRFSDTSL